MNVKDILNNKMTDKEKQWSRYYRILIINIGLMPDYDMGTGKPRPEKRLSPERFSTNYKTREEFERDREEILDYLERMEYPPEDLVAKVTETVKELDLQFGD